MKNRVNNPKENAIMLGSALETENSLIVRGIAAVMIMVGHMSENLPIPMKFLFCGNLWVGIFFFYSGYGLNQAINKNPTYLNGFVFKKIKKVYLPFVVAESLYTISLVILGINPKLGMKDIIFGCLGIRLMNSVLWYVIEIMAIYVLFYLINKFIPTKAQGGFICYFLFLLSSVKMDIGTCWYISSSAFLVGMYISKHSSITRTLLQSHPIKTILRFLFIVGYLFLKIVELDMIHAFPVHLRNYYIVALDMLLSPLFVLVLLTFSEEVLRQKKTLLWLGKISYNIYLYHMVFLLYIRCFIKNCYLLILFVSIVTIGFSTLLVQVRNTKKKGTSS